MTVPGVSDNAASVAELPGIAAVIGGRAVRPARGEDRPFVAPWTVSRMALGPGTAESYAIRIPADLDRSQLRSAV